MEGIRSLLGTTFEVVVMVADETSLFETIDRLGAPLAVVDLSLTPGKGLDLVRRLRARYPQLKLIVVGRSDDPSVSQLARQAGASDFVPKPAIATDLLPAIDALLEAQNCAPTGLPGATQ
jgi:two-component system secretion response regulator SsrB